MIGLTYSQSIKKISLCYAILALILVFSLISPVLGAGIAITAGDEIMKTDQLRNLTSGSGQGISVGLISSGVKHMADAQKSGDLPPVVHVLKEGKEGPPDEGTAMLEIIHDIAPNATLYFSAPGKNEKDFNNAIDSLVDAGCKVLVDDFGLLAIPYFEDGLNAAHLEEVLLNNPDIVYISAAGNNAQLHYQGTFSDVGGGFHSFNGSTGLPLDIQPGGDVGVILQWNDPFNRRVNAYSLYLFDRATGSEISISERTENGEIRAYEELRYQNLGDKPIKAEIRVKKVDGSEPNQIELIFKNNNVNISEGFTIPTDSIIGQAAAPRVISVAAVPAIMAPSIEKFSSQGAVTMAYPKSEERKKPDITGLNNVDITGAGGFQRPFTGTSAASPHIAGLIALEWSLFPQKSGTEIKDAMFQTATGLGGTGWNPIYGYGLPDALGMYEFLKNSTVSANQTQIPESVITPVPSITEETVIRQDEEGISTEILESLTITKPGYYTLGRDIMDSSTAIITIASSDVTLDGANQQIEGFTVQFGMNPIALQKGVVVESPTGDRLSNITIRNLGVMGTYMGISARNTDGLIIEGCRLPYNAIGLHLSGTSKTTVQDTTVNGNSYCGIIIDEGSSDTGISTSSIRKNLFGLIIDGSTNAWIHNNSVLSNHQEGFLLRNGATGNTLENNICSENGNGGISLKSSFKNNIVNNTCEQNTPWGIFLEESSENQITDNTLTANVRGINIYFSDTNMVTGNAVMRNKATGIMFQPSGRNIITKNHIVGNAAEGILITSGVTPEKVNLITDNYLENVENVRVQEGAKPNYEWSGEKSPGTNIINGPITGGNVWADPTGTGYSQTCSDSDGDGICDAPYTANSGIIDLLPLKYTGTGVAISIPQVTPSGTEPVTAEDYVTEGLALQGMGDNEGAIFAVDNALALSPANFMAWRVKALSLSKLAKTDEAIATVNEALKLYPDSIVLWYTLGDIYLLDQKAYDNSIIAYEKALAIDETDTHTLINLAYALDKTGRSEEALALYLKATTINPSLTDAWVKAGNIETRAKKFTDAIHYYDKALTIDPGNAFTWNNKGYALYLMGSFEDAVLAYQNAIDIDNTYSVAWKNLGNAYKALGRELDATDAFSRITQ